MTAQGSSKSREDVLQFLQELDTFAPTQKRPQSPAPVGRPAIKTSSKQDVKSFLDEFTKTSDVSNAAPAVAAVALESTSLVLPSSSSSSSSQAPESINAPPRTHKSNVELPLAKPANTISNTSALPSTAANNDTWSSWSSWAQSTAKTLTENSIIKQSLEKATQLAESADKMVKETAAESGNVMGRSLMAASSGKLGFEISKLTLSLVDSIAPPIESVKKHTITIWMCIEKSNDVEIDNVHDMVQANVNERWIQRYGAAICEKVIVHSVKDPNPGVCGSLDAAIEECHRVAQRMGKLAESSAEEALQELKNDMYLVVQPFRQDVSIYPNALSSEQQKETPSLSMFCSVMSGLDFCIVNTSQSCATGLGIEEAGIEYIESVVEDCLNQVYSLKYTSHASAEGIIDI